MKISRLAYFLAALWTVSSISAELPPPYLAVGEFRVHFIDRHLYPNAIETREYDVVLTLAFRDRFLTREYLLFDPDGQRTATNGLPEAAAEMARFVEKKRLIGNWNIMGSYQSILSGFVVNREIGYVGDTSYLADQETLGVYESLQRPPQGDPPRRALSTMAYHDAASAVPNRFIKRCSRWLRAMFTSSAAEGYGDSPFDGLF